MLNLTNLFKRFISPVVPQCYENRDNARSSSFLEHDPHGVVANDETLGEQINRLLADEPLRATYIVKGTRPIATI